jgi:molybdopterin/thiamine biosynthesis adenylyltransferase
MTPTITLVGCGFLGSILATEFGKLAFAGELPDALRLVDFDRVDHRNAANQNFTREDEGQYKSIVLAGALKSMHVDAVGFPEKLTYDTIDSLCEDAILVIDAVDNLEARQCLWAFAMRSGVPVLHVGLSLQGEGQVTWTTPTHDTFPLSPARLGGKVPADPPSGQQPPCELVKMRAAGWGTAYCGALAAAAYRGFDPLGLTKDADPVHTLLHFAAHPFGFLPVPELTRKVPPGVPAAVAG